MCIRDRSVGTCTTITLDGTTIDVIIAEKAVSFAEDQQYTAAGLNLFEMCIRDSLNRNET